MRLPSRPALLGIIAALALTSCGTGGGSADESSVTLTIAANSIEGGKNAESAQWIKQWVIPEFEKTHPHVKVLFQGSGVDDEQYKTRIALDLKSRTGADVIDLDGIWVGEFAQAGYIKPLTEVGGPTVEQWEGWAQIPQAVQGLGIFDGKKYGLPQGTDGRVLFYNKTLFRKAGLAETWQPTSWREIIDAGTRLKAAGVPVPIQLNAGTAMGEATTMQGLLPLLAGAGAEIYTGGKWTGAAQPLKDALGLYQQIYGGSGLGDPRLQQEAKGRDKSFAQFAEGRIAILAESDYFWRSVIEPQAGVAPMKDRDQAVGYAKIPAKQPGAGIRGQDFVSMSGGAVRVLNPFSKNPRLAWDLLAFMHSAAATKSQLAGQVRISARTDVNDEVLTADPMLKYIADEVLPLTAYRPGVAVYPQVSAALQEATAAVVSGRTPDQAATAYQSTLEGIVGGAANIAG
ncbi:extracellular solute-binding protein [Nonomuraea gerenzanensis]|uniref:Putative extracellular solute-binding lipoprotein n=1 Tax=Nonomuraea gerenzanensis TaxID=93944 RepID=A0A1M4EG99_9ACTN|nr:extracellular solute-binding protein [Nonomuraea gerenzanensis]UBU09587.1 extracellular solute-binding protein [Nonomuraea gerenzanensis]SBO98011.1 putative extracellular solute-binding lipoprotein [Nonomuraea gerenzanensis]